MSVCGFQNALKFVLFLGLFPGHFVSISNLNFRRLGLQNGLFRIESIKGFLLFLEALGMVFLTFRALETG